MLGINETEKKTSLFVLQILTELLQLGLNVLELIEFDLSMSQCVY